MKLLWIYLISFALWIALGFVIPFELYDWKFWVAVFFGNVLIFTGDRMLMPGTRR